jgi:phenylalanyl-tRNA synthetase beta chain
MKISLNWLKTLLDTSHSADELSAMLTAAGLEVEGREQFDSVPGGMKGLIIGEVIECSKHPDADRLSVTKVNVGDGKVLSIVCGAPNVTAGQKVVVATVGAKLHPVSGESFEIKKSKIRGQLSEGMLCAEDEIGIGQSHAGIIVLPPDSEVGQPVAQLFDVENDEILEIGLTPNRSDAASHYGVARDLAAILNSKEHVHTYKAKISGVQELPEIVNKKEIRIEIADTKGCPRYSGILLSGIKVTESPSWLQNRLRSIGVRPINNIVDITNFVLHELGQPLHAFDAEKIKGNKIVVRRAKENEKFVTLDGIERKLRPADLMICDESSPMCIAGIFGGAESGVTESTTTIFIESAYFDPSSVRQSSKHHGLKTDASFRFERGADPEMTTVAIKRAANLIIELAGGSPASEIMDVYAEKLNPYKVAFSYRNCSDLIGKDIDRHHVKDIILNLGIVIDSEGADGLLLYVPRYKHDVTREVDIVEEVMRVYGYDHIDPAKHISYGIPAPVNQNAIKLEERLSQLLSANGFSEIMGLSLSSSSFYEKNKDLVNILNPLSHDLNVMRPDLLYGGLQTIAHNINRQQHDLKLYEHGKVYSTSGKAEYSEKKMLSIFVTGLLFRENPFGFNQDGTFFYIRSVLDAMFTAVGAEKIQAVESTSELFQFGLAFQLNGKQLGEAGLVSSSLLKTFDIRQPVYYASLDWDVLMRSFQSLSVSYKELNKFPSVRRDLALLLDKSVKYGDVVDLAFNTEKKLLADVNLFDVYEDKKLGNKKSYAVRFTLQDKETTLTDKQIETVMDKLVKVYREKLGAELR